MTVVTVIFYFGTSRQDVVYRTDLVTQRTMKYDYDKPSQLGLYVYIVHNINGSISNFTKSGKLSGAIIITTKRNTLIEPMKCFFSYTKYMYKFKLMQDRIKMFQRRLGFILTFFFLNSKVTAHISRDLITFASQHRKKINTELAPTKWQTSDILLKEW